MRAAHRGGGRADPLHPRRRGRPLQPGLPLPQGDRPRGRARRPRPAAAARCGARGDGWTRVGWEEAYDEVARRIAEVQARHGRGRGGHLSRQPHRPQPRGACSSGCPLLRALRTRNRYSATSVDQLPHHARLARRCSATSCCFPVPDIDRTEFFARARRQPARLQRQHDDRAGDAAPAQGASRRAAAGWWSWIRAARRRPRSPTRTSSSARAPTPSSSLALLAPCCEEKLERPGRLAAFIDGLDAGPGRASRRSRPSAWPPPTGISAEVIRAPRSRLRRGRVRRRPTAGWASPRRPSAALCQWLIHVLNVVTGNLDRAGRRAVHPAGGRPRRPRALGQRGYVRHRHSRVRGLPEFGGELPVAALAEEMLTEGPGQIRALRHRRRATRCSPRPTGRSSRRRWPALDFMVSIDPYLNETTRHAHVILPPTSALEREHYDVVFHVARGAEHGQYSPALFEPAPGATHDWEILQALSRRLRSRGPRGACSRPLARGDRPRSATPRRLARPRAPGRSVRAPRSAAALGVEARGDPHGIDLGPLEPSPARTADHAGQAHRPRARGPRPATSPASSRELLSAPRAANGELLAHRPPRSPQQQLLDAQQPAPGEGARALHAAHAPGRRARAAASRQVQTVQVRSRVGSVPVRARASPTR